MNPAVLDLGRLTEEEPLLLFGGPYSNLQACEALRAKAVSLGIPPERCFCTGDTVAYCAQPAETVALLRDWGCHVLKGNCEESLAEGKADCGCGFEEGTACDLLSVQWYEFSLARVSREDRLWMGALPDLIRFEYAGKRFLLVHGAPGLNSEFVFPSRAIDWFETAAQSADADVIIGGHCGLPFTVAGRSSVWFNPGVIGMPANDGTKTGWFATVAKEDDRWVFAHHRLVYDHAGAVLAMKTAGLNNGYACCLETGLWPSMDVLPEAERALRARADLLPVRVGELA